MKTIILTLVAIVGFSSCIPNYGLINDLDLDEGWYCNFWGSIVVYGSITNRGSEYVSGVELDVEVETADGRTVSETITITDDIDIGSAIEFKEWLSYSPDEHPRRVSISIANAW